MKIGGGLDVGRSIYNHKAFRMLRMGNAFFHPIYLGRPGLYGPWIREHKVAEECFWPAVPGRIYTTLGGITVSQGRTLKPSLVVQSLWFLYDCAQSGPLSSFCIIYRQVDDVLQLAPEEFAPHTNSLKSSRPSSFSPYHLLYSLCGELRGRREEEKKLSTFHNVPLSQYLPPFFSVFPLGKRSIFLPSVKGSLPSISPRLRGGDHRNPTSFCKPFNFRERGFVEVNKVVDVAVLYLNRGTY